MQSRFSILDKLVPAFVIVVVLLLLHPLYLIFVRNIAYLALVSNFQGTQKEIPCNLESNGKVPNYSDINQVSYALKTIDHIPAKWLSFRFNYLTGYLDIETLNFLRKNDHSKTITLGPSHIRRLVDICTAAKDIISAENMIKNSDSIGLANPILLENLAELYTGDHKSLDAIGTYRHIIDRNPKWTAHYYIKIGEIYLSTGELDKAENNFINALAHGKEFNSWKEYYDEVNANFSLAETYRLKGLKSEAVYYYDQVVFNDQSLWFGYAAWVHLGEYQEADGLYHQAVESMLKAINCSPKTPWPHVSLGNLYGKLGDKAKAVEHYRIAESIDPTVIDFDKTIKDLENLP